MQQQSSLFDLPIDFISFGSGSSGNCYYLRQGDCGILIDMGVGIRRFQKYFHAYGFKLPQVKAALLTHDHLDHVRAAGAMSRKNHWNVYATQGVHDGMMRNPVIKHKVPEEHRCIIEDGVPFEIGPFLIESFPVPHDATSNSGFMIRCGEVSICIITDIGNITPEICKAVSEAQYLVVESNYDPDMLASGPYPEMLKRRISNGHGHLSNQQCGCLLRDFVAPKRIKRIWLCHLSQENNRPELAQSTVARALEELQLPCIPEPMRRLDPTGPYVLQA